MGEVCDTHGRDENYIQNFSRKKMKGGDNYWDLGVDGR
jgi:hypothetical protein